MADVKIAVKIISELKNFISLCSSNPELLDFFRNSKTDFTRNRKLSFPRLVLFISKLCKRTLSVDLDRFFEELDSGTSCSVSAFSQQRSKLNPFFFEVWNSILCESHRHHTPASFGRWRGYRLIAVDGSNVALVNTPSLYGHFGGQRNQNGSFVQAKTFYHYDVLSGLILHSAIVPYRTGELTLAYQRIEMLPEDGIGIYDRNFSNFKVFALHLWQERERKFVIRAKESMTFVRQFLKSGKRSQLVEISPGPDAIKGMLESGFMVNKDTRIKVRLVRVELPNTTEVIATNLWQEEGHGSGVFKELYFKRWGVETNISKQKNIMQLESFSGLTVESVKQDFYATVMMANLHSVLTDEAQRELDGKPSNRKHPMKINGNKSFGKMKENLIRLFCNGNEMEILAELTAYFIRDTLPIRPGRSYLRIKKNSNTKSKHRTYSNYKPAC